MHTLLTVLRSLQENVKTKHPQLLYESKLYKILQGGGEACGHCFQLAQLTPLLLQQQRVTHC